MLLRPHNALQLYFRIKKIPAGCSRTGRDAKASAIAWSAERGLEETVELDTSGGSELVQGGEYFRVRQPEISKPCARDAVVAPLAYRASGNATYPGNFACAAKGIND